MWPYWALFAFPVVFALQENTHASFRPGQRQRHEAFNAPVLLVIPILALLIGLRDEVGGDWANYVGKLEQANYNSIADIFDGREPGFELLQWLAIQTDWGVYAVNLVAGTLFSIGLVLFCRNLPRPWLALVVAIPYMVIVVAMGYTRQGLALGLCMLAMVSLGRQQTWRFVAWVVFASLFHNSAILLLPIAVLASTRRRGVMAVVLIAGCVLAYFAAFQETVDAYADAYISGDIASEGALIRLAMDLLPAACILRWGDKFPLTAPQRRLWKCFSIISVVLFLAYFVTSASTALDRMALYLLPLQLVVFSHLPDVYKAWNRQGRNPSRLAVLVIVAYCGAVQFVWLNFATHALFWIPYRFYPLGAQ